MGDSYLLAPSVTIVFTIIVGYHYPVKLMVNIDPQSHVAMICWSPPRSELFGSPEISLGPFGPLISHSREAGWSQMKRTKIPRNLPMACSSYQHLSWIASILLDVGILPTEAQQPQKT